MARNRLGAVFQRAKQAYRARDYETAERLARAVLERVEGSSSAHILLGTIFGSTKRYNDAIAEFNRAIETQPENAEAFNNLGVVHRQIGKSSDALYWLTRAIDMNPSKADIHYNLGNVHKSLNNFDEAIEAYGKAITIRPDLAPAYNNLGTLYEQRGDFSHASQVLMEGLNADTNSPTLRYNLGLALQSEGKLDDAREQFERALKTRPGWTDGLNNLGVCLQKLGEYDDSIRRFQEILRIDPDNATAHNNIATVLAKQGRSDEAIAYYKRALRNKPDYERAAVNLGQIMEGYRNQNESLQELRELVSRSPENVDLRLQLVHVLVNLQRFAEAEKSLRHILSRDSSCARAWQELGGVYTRLGKSKEAAECYRKLHELEPDNIEFRLELARILRDLKQYEPALAWVRRFLEMTPGDLRGSLLLGEVLCLAGQPQEGVEVLEVLKSEHPDNGNVLAALAEAYRLLGDRDRAIGTADELISLQGKRANPEDIEKLNESLGLYEKAVEAFEREHASEWQKSLERLGRLTAEGRPDDLPERSGLLQVEEMASGQEDEDSLLDLAESDEEIEGDFEELTDEEESVEDTDLEKAAREDDTTDFSLSELLSDESEIEGEPGEPEYDWPEGKKPDLSLFAEDDSEKAEAQSAQAMQAPQSRVMQQPSGGVQYGGAPYGAPPGAQQAPAGDSSVDVSSNSGASPQGPQWPAPPPSHWSSGQPPEGADLGGGGGPASAVAGGPVGVWPVGAAVDEPSAEEIELDDNGLEELLLSAGELSDPSESEEGEDLEGIELFEEAEELEEIEDLDESEPIRLDDDPTFHPTDEMDAEGIPLTDVDTETGVAEAMESPTAGLVAADARAEPEGEVPGTHPQYEYAAQTETDASGHDANGHDIGASIGSVPDRRQTEAEQEADMLDYLVHLARDLPSERVTDFEHSEFRLRIESLKARLAGRPGLLSRMQRYRDEAGVTTDDAVESAPVTPGRIADMLSFVRRLAGSLPDHSVGEILQNRAGGLLARLKAIRRAEGLPV